MTELILTQYSGKFLGPIAKLLGYLMNGIYILLDNLFHVQNVALTLIIFTIVIYLCLMPLTIKQQKFSKMSQIMQPELQAIQKKYKGRRDNASMQAQNEETQALYKKYGVSPSGSCIFLVIQLPILFTLYRVIYNVPAYITRIKDMFTETVNGIMATSGYQNTMENLYEAAKSGNNVLKNVSLDFTDATTSSNSLIDVLYKFSSSNWETLRETFSGLSDVITTTQDSVMGINRFLGLSVVDAPKNVIVNAAHSHQYIFILLAILIPVVAAGMQILNVRLMPQAPAAANGQNAMGSNMKMMNYMMPLYSLVLVFFLPIGVGIYWIAGSVIRTVQQLIINKYLDRVDMDALMKKNMEKAKAKEAKRAEKQGVVRSGISDVAKQSTRNIGSASSAPKRKSMSEKANSVSKTSYKDSNKKYKEGSMAAKANLVKQFNEKNNK